MKHLLIVVVLTVISTAAEVEEPLEAESSTLDGKSGTISLNGNDASTLLGNAVYIVPVLLFIILLDFAIFGAYANRSDDLNPVSDFFYHVRRGFGIVSRKSGANQIKSSIYQKYHKNRIQRSIEMLGPVLDALRSGTQKYD